MAEEVAPMAELKVPAVQTEHDVEFAKLKVPGGQDRQKLEEGAPNVVLYVPAEQAMHVDDLKAPRVELYDPAGH